MKEKCKRKNIEKKSMLQHEVLKREIIIKQRANLIIGKFKYQMNKNSS